MGALNFLFAAYLGLVTNGVLTHGRSHPFVSPDLKMSTGASREQVHRYTSNSTAPHIASGRGLRTATVGVPASFTIQLVGENATTGGSLLPDWEPNSSERFIYVWISNEDQIFVAEVFGDGNANGALTARYSSDFPGDYLVYIDEVNTSEHGEGIPITGSPFSLTIEGDGPTLDVNSLPVCDSQDDNDISDTFWRPGTWVSSNVASAAHGVMRNGWVFQPRSCVYDIFSFEDVMLLTSVDQPTWLLVLGGSIQRGVFHTLVDMALAQGQKDEFADTSIHKCWGYANLQIGNLRLTYQDMRLARVPSSIDSVICNDDKLISGSTTDLFLSAKEFLSSTVFQEGTQWPTTILSPAFFNWRMSYDQIAIEALMDALPPSWGGNLLLVDHMGGFGIKWREENPTRTALEDVGIAVGDGKPTDDHDLKIMNSYQCRDHRISFMSAFPMYQAKLFENQGTKRGTRRYGVSVHYHYYSSAASDPDAHNGTTMVHSTMTEMLASIMIGRAVGTKEALYAKPATAFEEYRQQITEVGRSFELCTDCPKNLLPVHVKPIPEPDCKVIESLPGNEEEEGAAWDGEVCPDWCMKEATDSQLMTQSGSVEVRECSVGTSQQDGHS